MAHMDDVKLYLDGVRSGEIPSGRLVRLAVHRHDRDMELAESRGLTFVPEIAENAIDFYATCCRHSTGEWAGQPFELSPWQKFIVASVFGWRREDGTRRFRRVLESVARKQGKTAKLAATALHLMTFDDPIETRAEIYCAATKEDQANILHSEAARMIQQSPALRNRLKTFKARRNIIAEADESFFRPIGSDSDSSDGLNPHAVLLDELHAWQDRHRGLYERLTTAGGSRRQPITWIITTAGDDQSDLWLEELEYATRVLEASLTDEVLDDRYFAYVASLDDKPHGCFDCPGASCRYCGGTGTVPADDPLRERSEGDYRTFVLSDQFAKMMQKANPNLGVSCKLEYLQEQALEAKNKPPAANAFKRFHCNIKTASVEKAIDAALWAACGSDLHIEPGRVGHGAFDMGRSDDFAAVAVVFPRDVQGEPEFDVLTWSWSCEASSVDWKRPPFSDWHRRGFVELHQGNAIQPRAIEDKCVELSQKYRIAKWLFDPAFAQSTGLNLINDHGLNAEKFVQAPTYYNEPCRTLVRLVQQRKLHHDRNPLLAWQAANLAFVRNYRDEWRPVKGGSPDKKIDAMVALLMALALGMYEKPKPRSIYESRGILSV